MLPLFATPIDVHPWSLVRVDDPDHPGAEARSEGGAVLLEPPPPGVRWRTEPVPEPDRWEAVEALEALDAFDWHDLGATGAGVKVAVFDVQWFGAEIEPAELGAFQTHDCWLHPSCELPLDTFRARFGFEQGSHGYACAEVIRDVAPDAELHLVRVNGSVTLESAVSWAIREEIDVISMSMSFFNASFYDGTGPIAAQMDRLAAAGVLMVTSAGNYAEGHWSGTYADADGDGRMDFDDDGLWVRLGPGKGVMVNWDQHLACGLSDLDVWLFDEDGDVVSRSVDDQALTADRCEPVERVRSPAEQTGWFRLEIRNRRGAPLGLRVDVLATDGEIAGGDPSGSIADPGTSASVFTVGAVRADGYLTNDVEPFSSWGPTLGGLAKPDIAGPDGLSTDAYGAVGFYGTSASTPAVAAAVALVMSDDPSLTPREAAHRLEDWAVRAERGRSDDRWGAGKARLPEGGAPTACGQRPDALAAGLPWLLWVRRRNGVRGGRGGLT